MLPLLQNFIDEYRNLKDLLLQNDELSLQTSVESHFTKTFLLSCASYHESRIKEILQSFFRQNGQQDERIYYFANNKGIERQYHTYFQWDQKNINNFLGLFGNKFKEMVCKEIDNDEHIKKCMIAFLTIGNERNKMVHENFIAYKLDKTFDEIVSLNELATEFIDYIGKKFGYTARS
jgi:hypothetical protein